MLKSSPEIAKPDEYLAEIWGEMSRKASVPDLLGKLPLSGLLENFGSFNDTGKQPDQNVPAKLLNPRRRPRTR
jgi:hypothetical protein